MTRDDGGYTAVLARERARQALQDYARRRDAAAGSTATIAELAPLVERARAAGLDMDTITELTTRTAAVRDAVDNATTATGKGA